MIGTGGLSRDDPEGIPEEVALNLRLRGAE